MTRKRLYLETMEGVLRDSNKVIAGQDEGQGIISTDDPSDETVKVWHEAKGYKIPKSGQVSGLMRHRYAKHAGVTS